MAIFNLLDGVTATVTGDSYNIPYRSNGQRIVNFFAKGLASTAHVQFQESPDNANWFNIDGATITTVNQDHTVLVEGPLSYVRAILPTAGGTVSAGVQ